jgi:hypothetical protein
LFCNNFRFVGPTLAGLHPDPYSSKFPPRTRKRLEQLRPAMAEQRSGSAACGRKDKVGQGGVGDARLCGERRRQALLHLVQEREFAPAAIEKAGQCGFTGKYVPQRAHG